MTRRKYNKVICGIEAKQVKRRKWSWSRLYALLNKPFSLWFLSSVLLAGAGMVHRCASESREERERKQELVSNLDLEIAHRLFVFHAYAQNYWVDFEGQIDCNLILDSPSEFDGNVQANIVPEYQQWPLSLLLLELERVVPEEEREKIAIARQSATKYFAWSVILDSLYQEKQTGADPEIALQELDPLWYHGLDNKEKLVGLHRRADSAELIASWDVVERTTKDELLKRAKDFRTKLDLERWGRPFSMQSDLEAQQQREEIIEMVEEEILRRSRCSGPSSRGRILDRNGQELCVNVEPVSPPTSD